MNAKTLSTLCAAYAVLADIRHDWPGRITPEGQTLLGNLRDAIAEETGQSPQEVQDGHERLDWLRNEIAAAKNPPLEESEERQRGEAIVDLLGLLPVRQTCRERETQGVRFDTTAGTKTALGLYRTIQNVTQGRKG